ncbi:hypothetical protein [Aeromonas phage 14AhydR10PP]|nr:hypothetical protein [Aeromonas phage 14AhydR10PP]
MVKAMKRRDARDNAPGDLVRKIKALTGIEAAIMEPRTGKGVRVGFGSMPIEVEFTSPSSRFRVITSPAALRYFPALRHFIGDHAIGGVVTGYMVIGDDLVQWFDVMPRYAASFVAVFAVCASSVDVDPYPAQHIDRVPDGFYEALVASQWQEVDVTNHPALLNPAQVSVLRHVDGAFEVIFAEDGVWLCVSWPFDNSSLSKMVRAMPKTRCLVDKGPQGWHSGHWDDYGASKGAVYVKWEGSLVTLQSQLKAIKHKRKPNVSSEFDPALPRPTHYSMTVH